MERFLLSDQSPPTSTVCVHVSVVSLLLQQSRDVDVPADRLSVKAAREQVTRLVLFVPRCAAHHTPVTLHTHI